MRERTFLEKHPLPWRVGKTAVGKHSRRWIVGANGKNVCLCSREMAAQIVELVRAPASVPNEQAQEDAEFERGRRKGRLSGCFSRGIAAGLADKLPSFRT